jgi:hypothetical protein
LNYPARCRSAIRVTEPLFQVTNQYREDRRLTSSSSHRGSVARLRFTPASRWRMTNAARHNLGSSYLNTMHAPNMVVDDSTHDNWHQCKAHLIRSLTSSDNYPHAICFALVARFGFHCIYYTHRSAAGPRGLASLASGQTN